MIYNSIIISYSTPNYDKLKCIYFNSLLNCDVNMKMVKHKLDVPDLPLSQTKDGFRSNIWYYSVFNKIKHLIEILNNSNNSNIKYFIYSDCDIWYLTYYKNEWDNLKTYIDNHDNDIFFMRENTSNDVNTGFFIIKNNKNINSIIDFFKKVIAIGSITEKCDMPLGDQTIVNNIKNEINYNYIPNDYVIFGTKIFNNKKSLFHHCVACNTIDEKINQIKKMQSLTKRIFIFKNSINIKNKIKH